MNPIATLLDSAARGVARSGLTRSDPTLGQLDWSQSASFNGISYPFGLQQTLTGNREEIEATFAGFAAQAYRSNGVVFACMLARMLLFSEARFQYQKMVNGRPTDLFGTRDLAILEHPWPGGTTGDLLARAIQDADLAGTAFFARRKGVIRRMRPDWVTIMLGSMSDPAVDATDIDAEIIGFIYHPGGRGRNDFEVLQRSEVAMFAPLPDPLASFRGMSWLTPVIREIQGDSGATAHKLNYFVNGATPNMVVTLDPTIKQEAFDAWIKTFEKNHRGVANAYKTLYLGAGAVATVVGSHMTDDFKVVQGAGETRIAAASGIHPTIVGLSEGLQGSALSTGNFQAAARLVADKTLRPLWRNFAGSMETIVPVPGGARLWYDDRDIPFLKDDAKDRAVNLQITMSTITNGVREGFTSESTIDAVLSGDYKRLEHTGLFSVQLQAPGSFGMPVGEAPGELPIGGGGSAPIVLAPPEPKQLAAGKASASAPGEVRCGSCKRKLAELATPPYRFTCRCNAVTEAGPDAGRTDDARALIVAADERQERLLVTLLSREQPPIVVPQVPPANVTIAPGAIQVTVEAAPPSPAPSVTFAEGSIRSDVHVEAAPAPSVTIAEGSIRSEVHVDAPNPEPMIPEPKTVRTEISDPIRGTIVITETEQ